MCPDPAEDNLVTPSPATPAAPAQLRRPRLVELVHPISSAATGGPPAGSPHAADEPRQRRQALPDEWAAVEPDAEANQASRIDGSRLVVLRANGTATPVEKPKRGTALAWTKVNAASLARRNHLREPVRSSVLVLLAVTVCLAVLLLVLAH